MDRDVLLAVVVAVFGTALFGSFYFGGSPTPETTLSTETDPAQAEERIYPPEDIRYAVQQKALKEREKAKKRKVIQASTTPDEGGSSDDSGDSSSVSDHAPVGEPDIE